MYPKRAEDCNYCKEFLDFNMDVSNNKIAGYERYCYYKETVIPRMEQHFLHSKQFHSRENIKQFAFTFTTNSDLGLEIQQEMCSSAWKLFQQNTNPVEEGQVYLEYTEQGRPHLHGWYECRDGGRIFAKTFRRCWRYWGEKERQTRFAGGFHEQMKTNRYKNYASDEGRLVVSKKINEDAHYYGEVADKWWFEAYKIE